MSVENGETETVQIDEQEIEEAVVEAFPAPEFREYQKKTIIEVVKAFTAEDKSLVLLNAPTGSGKSIVIYTAAKALQILRNDYSFITTPLNALVDQMEDDDFLKDMVTLKGRNNYNCIHPEDRGEDVDKAICQRDSEFECDRKEQCEYYGLKQTAIETPQAGTNMSYLMAEGMIPGDIPDTFGHREENFIDECQRIEDFAMNFVGFTVSKYTVPDEVWSSITIPPEKREDDLDFLVEWLQDHVLRAVKERLNYLGSIGLKTQDQTMEEEKLEQFEMRVDNFIDDVEENQWVAQIEVDINKNAPNDKKVVFQPIYIGRFLENLLWQKSDNIVLSSATIPSGGWLEEINLGDRNKKVIPVPSTFPVDNRPIVTDHAVGKMTSGKREDNAVPMVKKLKQLSEFHEGERGFVHCRSYGIAQLLKRTATNQGMRDWFSSNVMLQDRDRREESLEEWLDSDKQIFLSVAMDEGIDLEGDKCRWQVLAKTLYKHMGNKRVKYRVMVRHECDDCGLVEEYWEEDGPYNCPDCGSSRYGTDWDWYNRHAAIQLQQAYGRGVRSPTDECVFYILDSSAVGLVQRNAELFNGWFLEALHDMDVDPSRGI